MNELAAGPTCHVIPDMQQGFYGTPPVATQWHDGGYRRACRAAHP